MSRRSGRRPPGRRRPPGDVGHGKPTKEHQFKKGKSGNPNGRPRSSRSAGAIIEDILKRKVTVRDGHRTRKVTALEAMLLNCTASAMKGDLRALKAVLEGSPADRVGAQDLRGVVHLLLTGKRLNRSLVIARRFRAPVLDVAVLRPLI